MEALYAQNMDPWPRAIPKEITVPALIDTGASITILDHQYIKQMQLNPLGYCNISGFDSRTKKPEDKTSYPNYEMGLSLLDPSDDTILDIVVGQIVGHDIPNEAFSAIIGMDVLEHCELRLDGPNRQFELSAPERTVEEIRSVKKIQTSG